MSGMTSNHIALGLVHMTETASKARLVFASATIPPNRIISGSFWNCGAPPDRDIAVAIARTQTTHAARVAANAAIQSCGLGGPVNCPSRWKTTSSSTPITAKLLRLKMTFSTDWRAAKTRATIDPQSIASR